MNETSPSLHPIPSCARSMALLIAAGIFVSYAYFYSGGGWNQNTRLDLVRAIVERHTLSIDAYHENTGDKAYKDGHYYSDKAPGQPLLAVPAAAATRFMLQMAGKDPSSARELVLTSYVCNLFSVALPTAMSCAGLFLIALRLGASTGAASFGAIAAGLGTPLWAYATLFWGHPVAGACLVFAFTAALMLHATEASSDIGWGIAVGFAAGWATVTEYQALPGSAIVALFALARVWQGGWRRRLRLIAAIAAGALPCVAVLMTYLHFAFGSALNPSYSYVVGPFPWVKKGLFGLTYPRVDVVFKLLFGFKRGIFMLAPVTLLAPFGLRMLQKNAATRLTGYAAAAIFVYYLLLNASYSEWTAGLAFGPRIMGAGMPALCVGLAPAFDQLRGRGKQIAMALLAISVLFTLMAVATTPQPEFSSRYPVIEVFAPSFWTGHLALEQSSMLTPSDQGANDPHGAFNLGLLAGLNGLASLVPFVCVWLVAALWWVKLDAGNARLAVSASRHN